MSADYFFKKVFFQLASVGIAMFFLCICAYTGIIASAKRVFVGVSFYYLVTDDVKVEAGAEFAKLEGGAGYLLEYEGSEHVTLAVYLEESEGLAVQQNLQKTGRCTSLLHKGVSTLCFKGAEKQKGALYVNGLNGFKSYICVLKEVIDGLANGLTQEKCKNLLSVLLRQYKHAQVCFSAYQPLCELLEQSFSRLSILVNDVVYLKDLRYLLCWQTEKYLALCSEFSL